MKLHSRQTPTPVIRPVNTYINVKKGPVLQEPPKPQRRPALSWESLTVRNFAIEMCILAFCAVYVANIFWGRLANARVAKAFARQFCLPDGIFQKNFSLVGAGASNAFHYLPFETALSD